MDQIVGKYGKGAGIEKKVNAQILRNTFAVRLFTEEISVDKAIAILGISDAESINRYVQAAKKPPPQPQIPKPEEVGHLDTYPLKEGEGG